MFELLDNALKALAAYPPLAAFAALGIIGAGIWLIVRGERDRKRNGTQSVPSWALYGPVHDLMGAIHEMNEQSRKQVDLLERIDAGVQASKATLELIRNESRLR